ncbi:MAG: DMT family transporter [Rhodoferax sp.]|nr:DMT family transporter [Rhodoferax sp.]MCF8208654.1 DMT family transporter [Rhodoferax sp.]
MSQRKELDGSAVLTMLTLCLIWGMQQSLLKLTAPDMAPVMQIALRSGVAALLVGLFMVWKNEPVSVTGSTWRPGWLAGMLFAFEFLLVGEGLRHTTASHTAVFLYTAPIFAALGLHLKLPAERLNRLQWSGIALAFAGIVVTFLWRGAPTGTAGEATNMLLGDSLALLGGMAWGATTVVIRCSSLAHASASQSLLYQLLSAFVVLLLAALMTGQATVRWTPWVWGNLVFQSVVVSFASFLVWFWLLRHYLASRLGAFSFITPLFGVAFGVWLLNESLEPNFLVGAVLVLAGVIMVNSRGWVKPGFLSRYRSG